MASPAEQGELQTTVAKKVYGSLRETDWSTADAFWYSVGRSMQTGWVVTHDEQGRIGYPWDGGLDFEALTALKKLMADPVTGTWFSVSFTVTKQGRFTFSYNYDRRVYADPTKPTPFDEPSHRTLIEDQDWLDEFELYPRAAEHLPAFAAALRPAEPLVVNQEVLRLALDTPVALPASHAALADADGWADVIAVIADAAKRRFSAGEYPELLQSPYSTDWNRSEEALIEDASGDAVDAILPEGADDRVPRLYASLRAAGLGADADGDATVMHGEVQSAIDRLVQNDVVTRLAAIGAR